MLVLVYTVFIRKQRRKSTMFPEVNLFCLSLVTGYIPLEIQLNNNKYVCVKFAYFFSKISEIFLLNVVVSYNGKFYITFLTHVKPNFLFNFKNKILGTYLFKCILVQFLFGYFQFSIHQKSMIKSHKGAF